uniref:Ion_trans domain-containing protein n=1 Tax=Heterorhabditis bacteriophora TaxID=37862 RepID=A0A1I7WHI8_HETBA
MLKTHTLEELDEVLVFLESRKSLPRRKRIQLLEEAMEYFVQDQWDNKSVRGFFYFFIIFCIFVNQIYFTLLRFSSDNYKLRSRHMYFYLDFLQSLGPLCVLSGKVSSYVFSKFEHIDLMHYYNRTEFLKVTFFSIYYISYVLNSIILKALYTFRRFQYLASLIRVMTRKLVRDIAKEKTEARIQLLNVANNIGLLTSSYLWNPPRFTNSVTPSWHSTKGLYRLLLIFSCLPSLKDNSGANTKVTSPEGIALIDCTEDETIKYENYTLQKYSNSLSICYNFSMLCPDWDKLAYLAVWPESPRLKV